MKNIRLAVVLPTRNRGELAVESVKSVLTSHDGEEIGIIISDNSTDAKDSSVLEKFVSKAGSRVKLIHPKTPLGMTANWNYAMDYAMSVECFTHFTILTDRMLFKSDSIKRILGIISSYEDDVLSYTYDRIYDADTTRPIIYTKLPRSEDLIRIESARLLAMSAHMSFPSCMPRMLNSVSPRQHLHKLKARYARVFSSISPDFNFCFLTLDICNSFIYYDRALLINYSQGRSNGASVSRGVMSRDSKDFLEHLDGRIINEYSPIPEIITVGNSIVHEYCNVQRQSHGKCYPEISIDSYRDRLAAEVYQYDDPHTRNRTLGILYSHSWKPSLQYRISRLKRHLVKIVLHLFSRKFSTVAEAITYACSDNASNVKWIPHPARSYGLKIPLSPQCRDNTNSNM